MLKMIAKRFEPKERNKIYYQSFHGHIEDGLKILHAYFTQKKHIIENFCERWNLDAQMFYRNMFLTVAFHDIGKMTVEFQSNISQGKKSSRHPHALFGMPVLQKVSFDNVENLPLFRLAILGHHTQIYRWIYHSNKIATRVKYYEVEIKDFINNGVNKIYNRLNFSIFFTFPEITFTGFKLLNREEIWDEIIKPIIRNDNWSNVRIKAIYTYLFSILQLCDDYSSAHFHQFIEKNIPAKFHFDSVVEQPSAFVYDINLPEEEFKKRLFKGFSLRDFQKELSKKACEFSFLFAPCGRGKTEAALWWAYQLKNKLKRDRIIFALPTQVTCNAMYTRLIEKTENKGYGLGEKVVGLFHGKSKIHLKYQIEKEKLLLEDGETEIETSDFKEYNLLKDETFKGNVFFKPITVTTIDHLAYAFVHGFSQADFACGNLQNAIIIFDEVHYYEQHTLEVLLRLFSILRKMGIPHLLMTGTAPQFLLDNLEDYTMITDSEGLAYQPFIIRKQEQSEVLNNSEVLKSIYEDYKCGKRIFVIMNQIDWVQKIYQEIKAYFKCRDVEPDIILYHSRYIHRDRVRKEEEIRNLVNRNSCILVATQVIEISLDISCDIMYTTIAPPDAIGQRAGRLNRSGKFYQDGFTYELKLFQAENHWPYPESFVKNSWKAFKNGPISYRIIKEVCDEVYQNIKIKKDKRYRDFFEKNILFGDHYSDVVYNEDEGKAIKIREIAFQQIDVVPSRVFEEAEKRVLDNNAFWAEYHVKIPFWRIKHDFKEYGMKFNFQTHAQYHVIECDYEYDYEKGVQFDKTFKRINIW